VTAGCGHPAEIPEGLAVPDLCLDCEDELELRSAAAARVRRRRERVTTRAGRRRAAIDMPRHLQGREFADLATWPGDVVLAAHAWSIEGGGLYLWGPNGTGKTTLAAAAAWAALEHRNVRWIKAATLATFANADFDSEDFREAKRLMRSRDALVIDDLGQEPHTVSAAGLICNVLDARLDARAPLLITSNHRVSGLAAREHYGTWLGSRLAGYCQQWELGGRDHRLDHYPGGS
jgi:DNA replication protein DnaC